MRDLYEDSKYEIFKINEYYFERTHRKNHHNFGGYSKLHKLMFVSF